MVCLRMGNLKGRKATKDNAINDCRRMHIFAGKHERKTWVFVNNYQEVRLRSSCRLLEVDTHAVPWSDCFCQKLKISFEIARFHLSTHFADATNIFSPFAENGKFRCRTKWYSRAKPGCLSDWCKSVKVVLEVETQTREKASGTTFSAPRFCLIL